MCQLLPLSVGDHKLYTFQLKVCWLVSFWLVGCWLAGCWLLVENNIFFTWATPGQVSGRTSGQPAKSKSMQVKNKTAILRTRGQQTINYPVILSTFQLILSWKDFTFPPWQLRVRLEGVHLHLVLGCNRPEKNDWWNTFIDWGLHWYQTMQWLYGKFVESCHVMYGKRIWSPEGEFLGLCTVSPIQAAGTFGWFEGNSSRQLKSEIYLLWMKFHL